MRAEHVAGYLGKALLDARRSSHRTQAQASDTAGIAASTWSHLERGHGADVSLLVWTRAARAVGADLRAYIPGAAATDQPRDAAHLRAQELIVRTAAMGGWRSHPERALDADPSRSRAADVVLSRSNDLALVEVYDWLPDVGEAFRVWDRKLATVEARTLALAAPGAAAATVRASGLWVLRATRTNRRLVADHRALFKARFPGSAVAWLACLTSRDRPMPTAQALIWISLRGDHLVPSRLG